MSSFSFCHLPTRKSTCFFSHPPILLHKIAFCVTKTHNSSSFHTLSKIRLFAPSHAPMEKHISFAFKSPVFCFQKIYPLKSKVPSFEAKEYILPPGRHLFYKKSYLSLYAQYYIYVYRPRRHSETYLVKAF